MGHDLTVHTGQDDGAFTLVGSIGGGQIMRLTILPISKIDGTRASEPPQTLYAVRAASELPGGDLAVKQNNFMYDSEPESPLWILYRALCAIMDEGL